MRIREEWNELAVQRLDEVLAGTVTLIDSEDSVARARAALAHMRSTVSRRRAV